MERLGNSQERNLPGHNGTGQGSEAAQAEQMPDQTAEALLRSVTQDLRSLQQDLLSQLNQDIGRLQAEKSRLVNDVEKLQAQQQSLQSQHEVDLSKQQLAQQQAWAKQLALVLANHLQTALNERLSQTLGSYPPGTIPQITGQSSQLANQSSGQLSSNQSPQIMASLDDTVNRTFASLRHDINSYQSSLGQQLERMHTMGQQGEAILEVLVKRLSQQLQVEATRTGGQRDARGENPVLAQPVVNPASNPFGNLPAISPPTNALPTNAFAAGRPVGQLPMGQPSQSSGNSPANPPSNRSGLSNQSSGSKASWTDGLKTSASQMAQGNAPPLEFGGLEAEEFEITAPAPGARTRPQRLSVKLGLGLVLAATVLMALHYVGVGVMGNSSQLFGQQTIGGYLSLNQFSNAALLLWIRMLIVIPVMFGLSTYLHPATLSDIRIFTRSSDKRAVWGVVGSGIFLFLSQVFLFIAIGQAGPGVAIAALFIYPVGVLMLNMLLFAERITFKRIGMIAAILLGAALAVYPLLDTVQSGILAALLAAVTFTFYLVAMQIGARKLHPVPTSLIQFATMFVLGSISLIVFGVQGAISWTALLVGGIVLALLTVSSYALNHFGVRAIGAARSSIIASSTPALTALLAFFLVPGALTTLNMVQIVGILIVTLGGTALGLERMLLQTKAVRQAKQRERELEDTRV